ncbi:MAG: nicotinate (nicotinamide) nucleotide adenylyltransferase [Chitinophagales bacterium]
MPTTKKHIGLMFGSFNPVHTGHLIIAETVAQLSHIDQVWLVLSPQNPFKTQKSLLNQYDRLHLANLAVENNPLLSVSSIEFDLPKPSYTIDTLAYLYEKYPTHEFSLIMGEDNLVNFHKWKNYEQILKYYHLLVYPRPNYRAKGYDNHEKITRLEVPLLEISATYIRNLLKKNKSIRYLVPDKVNDYIVEYNLWR